MTSFADAILLQIWLYTHMPSLVWIVWKINYILHIVQSVAWDFASVYYELQKGKNIMC